MFKGLGKHQKSINEEAKDRLVIKNNLSQHNKENLQQAHR